MQGIKKTLDGMFVGDEAPTPEQRAYVLACLEEQDPGALKAMDQEAADFFVRGMVSMGYGEPRQAAKLDADAETKRATLEADQRRLDAALADRAIENAGIPRRHLVPDDGRSAEKTAAVSAVLARWTHKYGSIFTFSGETGSGKSFAAAQVLKSVAREGGSILWIDLVELANLPYDRLEEMRRRSLGVAGLVLDDLGKAGAASDGIKASRALQHVHLILDRRASDSSRLTIVTSEYAVADMPTDIPRSIVRRLADGGRDFGF